ncbi:MAG TPA: Ig-like domain-containing protein [Gemmatimonadales bacterium]|nr:Ig-like domain-containing protein [Gemmatimonadales bacterium]
MTKAGDSVPVAVVWTARYGTITADGLYTAPASVQEDVVTARATGTAYSDSAVVNLVALPVGEVDVFPGSVTVPVGGAALLRAVVLNTRGDTLGGHTVSWGTSDASVAGVQQSGLVQGVAVGNATVTAAAGGHQGSSSVTVTQPPPPGTWPNEPANYQLISEQPFDVLNLTNWNLQFGTAVIMPDPSAPFSAPDVLDIVYPIGFGGGQAPGTMQLTFPQPYHSVYVGTWWKASNPWQGQDANVDKIQYIFSQTTGSMFMCLYGPPGGPFEIRVFPQFSTSNLQWLTPNVNNVAVSLGTWHRIEWLVTQGPTQSPPSGIVQWWLDGQLIGSYNNVSLPPDLFAYYKVAPVWGGVGDVKTELDFFEYDHVHVSGN